MRGLRFFAFWRGAVKGHKTWDKEKGDQRIMTGIRDRLAGLAADCRNQGAHTGRSYQQIGDDLERLVEQCAGVHTTADVAALVEEIKAKTYDGVKARFLTLLEALLQAKGLGTGSIGRMVDILLQDLDNQVLAVAGRHVPEITPAMVDEARHQRELCVLDTAGYGLVYRARDLKEQAEVAERLLQQFNQKADQKRRQKLFAMLGDPSPETVAAVMAVLESTDKPRG